MDIKKIIREEIGDFNWAKEINPIQCKDLRGYYFNYGSDTKKYTIISIELDDYADELIIHYKYPNSSEYEHTHMKGDTFIYRVKLGDYRLYDKNGNDVDPRNLVYTDNTFDDGERKEIWEQDGLDWIRDVEDYDYEPKHNDYIEVINIGSEKAFLDWLGIWKDDYLDGLFGTTIKGKVFISTGISLEEENTDRNIAFPSIRVMHKLTNSEEYSGLKLMYKPLIGDGRNT